MEGPGPGPKGSPNITYARRISVSNMKGPRWSGTSYLFHNIGSDSDGDLFGGPIPSVERGIPPPIIERKL